MADDCARSPILLAARYFDLLFRYTLSTLGNPAMLLNQHRGVEIQKVHGNERSEYEGHF